MSKLNEQEGKGSSSLSDSTIQRLTGELERVKWNLYEAYSDGYISKYIFDRIINADMKNERKEQDVLRKKLKLYAEYARLLDEDRNTLLEYESSGDISLHTKRIGEIVDELNVLLLKDKTQ